MAVDRAFAVTGRDSVTGTLAVAGLEATRSAAVSGTVARSVARVVTPDWWLTAVSGEVNVEEGT